MIWPAGRMRSGILALIIFASSTTAFAGPRIRLGGVVVSGGYSSWRGPYSPYFYSPFFYDPFYSGFFHPGYYGGFGYGQNLGQVKLHTEAKDAIVFLNGAYAGPVSKLKNMWLEPGSYNLEIRDGSQPSFEKRIYVLTGKKLDIRPKELSQ
jgi:hypothetical protein